MAKGNIPYACWDSKPKSLACSGLIHLLSWLLVITVLTIKKVRSISTGLTGGQDLHFPLWLRKKKCCGHTLTGGPKNGAP